MEYTLDRSLITPVLAQPELLSSCQLLLLWWPLLLLAAFRLWLLLLLLRLFWWVLLVLLLVLLLLILPESWWLLYACVLLLLLLLAMLMPVLMLSWLKFVRLFVFMSNLGALLLLLLLLLLLVFGLKLRLLLLLLLSMLALFAFTSNKLNETIVLYVESIRRGYTCILARFVWFFSMNLLIEDFLLLDADDGLLVAPGVALLLLLLAPVAFVLRVSLDELAESFMFEEVLVPTPPPRLFVWLR